VTVTVPRLVEAYRNHPPLLLVKTLPGPLASEELTRICEVNPPNKGQGEGHESEKREGGGTICAGYTPWMTPPPGAAGSPGAAAASLATLNEEEIFPF
jgi:hypothetical protein